ncbi:hypothetical protein BD413DRAFT_609104 [Trametes elegans]|nr:hypothetical protein BD413DRAFT_609104 [Trametes elegans]
MAGLAKEEEEEEKESNRTPVGTPLDHPGSISVSTAFHPSLTVDDCLPDLILVSSDGVHFYVHSRRILAASSNNLGGLFPSDHNRDVLGPPTITVQSSDVLNVALHAMYGFSCLHYFPTLEVVDAALLALIQYGVAFHPPAAPSQPLYQLLVSYAPYRPLDAYALAAQHALEEAAVAISSHLLAFDLASIPDEAAQKMGPLYLKRLFILHQSRIRALRNILFKPPQGHLPAPGCTQETAQQLMRAWALAAAQLVWDVLPSVSTGAIRALFDPLATKLDCALCAVALRRRVQEVEFEWSAVKRTI